jgi:lysophospholipase L1-like esterase
MDERVNPRQRPRRRVTRRSNLPAWAKTGLVFFSAFMLWLVMDATVLQHNALVNSPLGTRRAVALGILDPLADFSRAIGLDLPVQGANEALGRTGVGGFVIPTVPTTTTIPGTTTTTTTIPLHPTAKHPLRILLFGDSIGTDLDEALLEDLQETGVAIVWTDDHIDTGIVNSAYFAWIPELAYDVYHLHPQIVIGMMGANDDQSFLSGQQYPSNAWNHEYEKRVGQLFATGAGDGRKMLWVSVPLMSTPGWEPIRIIQHLEAVRHHVYYIDSETVLNPGHVFHLYLRVNGTIEEVRTTDGIHLAPAGASLLAQTVMVALERDLHVRLRW